MPRVGRIVTAHGNLGRVPGWLDLGLWRRGWSAEAWREHLRGREEEEIVATLRLCTHTGRPLGSDRRPTEEAVGR